jgi:hypothetical protein
MRIGTRGTTPYRLRRFNDGFGMTRPTIEKISENHGIKQIKGGVDASQRGQ